MVRVYCKLDKNNQYLWSCFMNGANEKIVQSAINKGGDINMPSDENMSLLIYALRYEEYNRARLLIDNKVEIDRFYVGGHTALLYFCFGFGFGDALDKIKFLVENGADVNKCHERYNYSPLHLLAESDQVEAVKYLISKGADLNAKDSDGDTPLDYALRYGNQEIIDLLR